VQRNGKSRDMMETMNPASAASETGEAPLIKLERVHVSFGGTIALVDESFEVLAGEIIGLLGHNGAGKSTLVNVATGAVRPQRGTMFANGQPVPLRGDPKDMEHFGIKVIHQVPALAGNLPIYENITLGRTEERWSRNRRRQAARDALALLGTDLNVDRPVSSLFFGEKQLVDLARALSTNVNSLFLDEPTGALGQRESQNLHELLRKLAAERHGIVYVSHRLKDIMEVCSRIVVLRGGRIMLNRPARAFTLAELSEALAPGISSAEQLPRVSATVSREHLLKVEWHNQHLKFGRGEVVGLFGMAGGPQFRFLEALFGLDEKLDGQLEGTAYCPRSPRDAISSGVYYVSADRERDGLVLEMSALENLILPWLDTHRSGITFSYVKAARSYQRAVAALKVRGGHMNAPIGSFSGGNRQKIVIGRWLFGGRPRVLLLAQPTQGVDVGARLDIARALKSLADKGVTIIVASSEADEISLLCGRALICEGDEWRSSRRTENWEEQLLKGLVFRAKTPGQHEERHL
jgi:ABC-type sugar transport system ATPase subunit